MKVTDRAATRHALVGICLSFFMVVLDTTAVNAALPALQTGLNASIEGLLWSVNAYTLAFASLLLTAGALGDRLGSKRVFVAGLAVFTAASAGCSLSASLLALVGWRVLQGIGAAALMPTSLSLIAGACPQPKDRARGIGLWGGMGGLAIATGPVVGGLLADGFGWQSIFLVNIPVGAISLVLTARHAQSSEARRHGPLDLMGQGLGVIALAALTYGLIEGPDRGWGSPSILFVFLIATVASILFLLVEHRGSNAMLPVTLFRSPTFAAAVVVGFLLNFGLYGLLFVLSLYMQNAWRYSALATGLAFLPLTATITVTLLKSGWVAARFGPHRPMIVGMPLAAAGCVLLLFSSFGAGYGAGTVAGFILTGLGIALTMPAMTAVVLASAPPKHAGIACGVLSASRQCGGVIGVALLGSLLSVLGLELGLTCALAIVAIGFLVNCGVTYCCISSGD